MSRETPEQVLKSIVDGINTGNLDALMSLYEPEAAFAAQPGSLAHGSAGVRDRWPPSAMKGTLISVTRVLEAASGSRRRGLVIREPGRTVIGVAGGQRGCSVVRKMAPGACDR